MINRDLCRTAIHAVETGIADSQSIIFGAGRSILKGLGYEYVDFRPYMWGDDIRHIDWRLSARMLTGHGEQRLVVKEYMSERKVEVLLAIDLSAPMYYWEKAWITLYSATLILEAARKLDDKVHAVIMNGRETIYIPYTIPLDITKYLVYTACREKLGGKGDSLIGLTNILPKLKRIRGVVLITDYAHDPINFYKVGVSARALESSLGVIIATSRHEIMPPKTNALIALQSPTGRILARRLGEVYREIQNHVAKCRTYIAMTTTNKIEATSMKWIRENKHKIIDLYMKTRQHLRTY